MKVRSGYWPDWWNWYNALGNKNINLQECWQLVDEHHVPGTRSAELSKGAQCQTCYLRIVFQKDVPLTLSAYLKSDRPDTKVNMFIYQDGWNEINEVTEVTVGTEWKRYHVTATPEKKSRGQHNFVRIGLAGPGTLWVNAPQLEEGSAPTEWKLSLKDTAKKDDEGEEPVKPKFAIPKIDCLKVETAPVLDGALDDPAWEEAAATERFVRLDEDAPAKHPTVARICRDDEAIYIAFRCEEPEMDKLTAKHALRDSTGIFQEDCVEVLISGNEDGTDYLRFAASALGTKVDSKGHTKFFDTEWDCATGKGDDFWTIEFRLPFSSLVRPLQPGSPWRLNLARFRARPKEEEYSAWAPVVRSFHDFEHFGFLRGVIAEVAKPAEEAPAQALVAYLDRSFYTTERQARVFVDAPEGTAIQVKIDGKEREAKLSASRLAPIDISTLGLGNHPVEVLAGDLKKDLVLVKLPAKENAVKIDRIHRILLADDKPFIPVGSNGGRVKSANELADHGFNGPFANMHGAFTDEMRVRIRAALDAAHARGMKTVIWYNNYAFIDDHAGWQAELLTIVETFKDHPALLGWWVFDEPVSGIKWLKGLCDAVREADPYHPVFVNWCDRGHGWTADMGDVTGDVNCLDGYYINCYDYTPREAFLKIGGHCTEMTDDAKTRGNVVAYINGIHGWASAIREPSPEENIFVTYVSLIRGARMLYYYMWAPPASSALRESFKPLCLEIEALTPIVANPEVKERVACDNERIDYTAFQAKDGLYVIALNTDENDETATFHVEGAKGEALVLFEDRRRGIEGGSFQDTFKPIERHVYRIAGATP